MMTTSIMVVLGGFILGILLLKVAILSIYARAYVCKCVIKYKENEKQYATNECILFPKPVWSFNLKHLFKYRFSISPKICRSYYKIYIEVIGKKMRNIKVIKPSDDELKGRYDESDYKLQYIFLKKETFTKPIPSRKVHFCDETEITVERK